MRVEPRSRREPLLDSSVHLLHLQHGSLLWIDEEPWIGGVVGNQATVLVTGRVESLATSANDMFMFVTDERVERSFVASRDGTDDSILPIPHVFLGQHLVSSHLKYTNAPLILTTFRKLFSAMLRISR